MHFCPNTYFVIQFAEFLNYLTLVIIIRNSEHVTMCHTYAEALINVCLGRELSYFHVFFYLTLFTIVRTINDDKCLLSGILHYLFVFMPIRYNAIQLHLLASIHAPATT